MDRRQFIKFTAATSATATLAGCGNPELHLARFIPEEELIPGIAAYKPSICPLCEAGCGIVVKVMQGEAEVIRKGQTGLIKMGLAKKLEGNPAHPISQGKLAPAARRRFRSPTIRTVSLIRCSAAVNAVQGSSRRSPGKPRLRN